MTADEITIMVFGGIFSIGTAVFLIRALLSRSKLLPEEEGKRALFSIYPQSIHLKGRYYAGPFSRVSIYDDFLVIRALGVTTILRRSEIAEKPSIHGNCVHLSASMRGGIQRIKIYTDCNQRLVDKIDEWKTTDVKTAASSSV